MWHAGMLINRSAYALTGIDLNLDRQGLAGTVGLVLRVKGDGLTYAVTLTNGEFSKATQQQRCLYTAN